MKLLFSPAIALSNNLRFKAKFSVLALIFYMPLIACFVWIVNDQAGALTKYQHELDGFELIEAVIKLEQTISATRQTKDFAMVDAQLQQLQAELSQTVLYSGLIGQIQSLKTHWQSKGADSQNFSFYDQSYRQTLSLRENIGALSGLTRENDASAYYLMETGEQHLPALYEYLTRFKDLSLTIIAQGFDAERYTLIVALDKRVAEFNDKLAKTLIQLSREADNDVLSHLSEVNQLVEGIKQYLTVINQQLIEPDDILIDYAHAQTLAEKLQQQLLSFKARNNQLLKDRIVAMQYENKLILWVLTIGLILVTVGSVYLLVAIYLSIRSNVEGIRTAAEHLGNGNFNHQLDITTNDELGDIGRSFCQMQHKISQLLLLVQQDVQALRQVSLSINDLTQTMQRSIAEQQQETHSIVAAVSQVSDSVNTVAQNTQQAEALTQSTYEQASQGQTVVLDTGATIEDISQEVNHSASVINQLAQDSNNITRFVDVIREIADQTNLLALNAAIEAARAGEQGRGFAVVADEVRALAAKTQDATTEIQRIIETLRTGAEQSLVVMNDSVEKAQLGVEKTSQVQHAFAQVSNNVNDIVLATTEISTAIIQQQQMVHSIDANTANISQGADDVLQSANKTSDAAKALANLADHLSAQLKQFSW